MLTMPVRRAKGRRFKILLICIRFLGVVIPQTGYIHPDEFFQGPEIAGEILDYEVYRAWEFNCTKPIRTIAFPLMIGYSCFFPLKYAADYVSRPIPSCLLLAVPRFLMFCLSLVHDYHLSKMCSALRLDSYPTSIIFGTSYVCFVFMIRTFSNCLEAALFTVLLSIAISKLSPYRKKTHSRSSTKDAILIGSIVAAGIFLRPTFLLFAVTPILFWCFPKGLTADSNTLHKNLKTILASITVAIAFICLDTVYFQCKSSNQMNVVTNIVLTPLNFFLYNSKTSNLKNHGLHPRYLHFLLNIPIMYGILGIVALYGFLKHLAAIYKIPKCDCLLQLSWFVPTLGLSLFPHQEPRFLIPLLVPLVLLHAGTVYRNRYFRMLWVISNAICAVIFGCAHQGGLVPFLLDSSNLRSDTSGHVTIFFSHSYMPPQHLLQLKNGQKDVHVQDLGFSMAVDSIPGLYYKENCLAVFPGSVDFSDSTLSNWRAQGKHIQLLKSYFPHLSTEHPPDFSKIFSRWKDFQLFWKTFVSQMSLHVYKIT